MIVYGEDSRRLVPDLSDPPHSAICYLQAEYDDFPDIRGYGTGFLLGHGRIATAGHVLWNDLLGALEEPIMPDRVRVYLGEGLYQGHPELTWTLDPRTTGKIHPQFLQGRSAYDLARLQLPRNPGHALSILGFPADLRAGERLCISGYPMRTPQSGAFGAYEGDGALATLGAQSFDHEVDTDEGQSGAPVRVRRRGVWHVIGVHVGNAPVGDDGIARNRAVALTAAMVTWLLG